MRNGTWDLYCVLCVLSASVGSALSPLLIRPDTEHMLPLLLNNAIFLSRFRHVVRMGDLSMCGMQVKLSVNRSAREEGRVAFGSTLYDEIHELPYCKLLCKQK
jgi:hypothetical protein